MITGASEGIGRELSKLLALDGHNLYLIARNSTRLKSLKEEIENENNHIHFISCDVSDYEQCKATFDIAKGEFSSIDMAILNAGIGINQSLSVPHIDKAQTTMGINYFGVVNFGSILLPYFKKRKKGYFIGISSLADARGFEGSGIYCSSKAALTTYLEAARTEMKHYGVKVMTVKPGFVDTNMTKKNKYKMPFLMNAEKAAKKIHRAISNEKLHYSFPWKTQLGAYLIQIMPDRIYDKLALLRGKVGQ